MFFGTQVAANDMIDRDDPGNVVNIASISSEDAQHDQVQYDATKGAIKMITRGAALELAEYDVRVNAVAPGQIATEFTEGWSDEARDAAGEGGFLKPVPLERAGSPRTVRTRHSFWPRKTPTTSPVNWCTWMAGGRQYELLGRSHRRSWW